MEIRALVFLPPSTQKGEDLASECWKERKRVRIEAPETLSLTAQRQDHETAFRSSERIGPAVLRSLRHVALDSAPVTVRTPGTSYQKSTAPARTESYVLRVACGRYVRCDAARCSIESPASLHPRAATKERSSPSSRGPACFERRRAAAMTVPM